MDLLDQPTSLRYASFGQRTMANLIDSIIIGLLSAVFFIFSFGLIGAVVVSWLYFALMESGGNQDTYGKRVMGIYVGDLDGRRISFWRAAGRHLLRVVSFGVFFVGLFMMFFTARRQCLHDLITGTVVLRK